MLSGPICYTSVTSSFSIEVHTSAALLPQDWDGLEGLPEELQTGILSFEESTGLEHFSYLYLLIRKSGRMVGCMYFQLLELQADYYPDITSLPLSVAGFFKYLKGRDYRLLICGHVFFNYRRSVYLIPGLTSGEADKLYARSIREALKKSEADIFLSKEPTDDFKRFLSSNPRRFLSVGPDNLMTLAIRSEWKNAGDYSAALKKKYAQRLKKIRENALFFSCQDITDTVMHEHETAIMQAYFNVLQEAEFKLGKLNFSFFFQLKKQFPKRVIFRLWKNHNQALGFSILLLEKDAVELYYIGLPKDEELKRNLYQSMMLNALEYGIEHKLKEVRFGRTALEAKAMFGAEPEEQTHYLAFQNRWLRYPALALLRHAGGAMGNAWRNRKPFRQDTDEQNL